MKKFSLLGCLMLMTLAGSAMAQRDEIEVTRASIQADRQKIVAAAMGLSEAKGQAFWPMYREYRQDMAKSGDKMVGLLENYAAKYDTMTDADAESMLKDYINIQKQELDTKTKWMKKFKNVLGGKDLARFYQVEGKLDTIIRYDLAQAIPLVK
ncbi:MAG TPA: hypothetical protein VNM87_05195 [Candidatus Udaeobacter sp.]|nr:hypothetical protein [Candidatus Udaeobacter sp.]